MNPQQMQQLQEQIAIQNGYWTPSQPFVHDARYLVDQAKARLADVDRQLAQRDSLEKEAKQLRAIIEAAEKAL